MSRGASILFGKRPPFFFPFTFFLFFSPLLRKPIFLSFQDPSPFLSFRRDPLPLLPFPPHGMPDSATPRRVYLSDGPFFFPNSRASAFLVLLTCSLVLISFFRRLCNLLPIPPPRISFSLFFSLSLFPLSARQAFFHGKKLLVARPVSPSFFFFFLSPFPSLKPGFLDSRRSLAPRCLPSLYFFLTRVRIFFVMSVAIHSPEFFYFTYALSL